MLFNEKGFVDVRLQHIRTVQEILSIKGTRVKLQHNYEIEVESNGLYKLLDDGYIVAPFDASMNCAGL